MNNIKVTVEYETPKTDKFTSLLKQYEETKKTADEVTSYYKPLADMAEETKLSAILEQLETIKSYMRTLYEIKNEEFRVYAFGSCSITFDVVCLKHEFIMRWGNDRFSMFSYKNCPRAFNAEVNEHYNILGNWDNWRIYEQLENRCLKMLTEEIEKQKSSAESHKKRLENIVGV